MKLAGFEVTPEYDLLGCRIWAFHYSDRGFELFDYVGKNEVEGLHFFLSRTTSAQIARKTEEVVTRDFKPFLIDCRRLEEERERLMEKRRGKA
jgi:hypothetical protein